MIHVFADCELDTTLCALRRGGAPVPIEPLVFNVLVHLVRHRDRLVTKLDFIEKCAASAADEAVKDGFITEHVIGTLEGEPEWSEVTERAPASPHVGPVEQLEAI